MNKLTKTAIVAAGFALAAQGAFATGGDLILSVNDNSASPAGSTEFTMDLGSLTSIEALGPNGDLNGFVSTFNGYNDANLTAGLNIGAVGGLTGQGGALNPGIGNYLLITAQRTGGGSYTSQGTEANPSPTPNASEISGAGSIAAGTITQGNNVSTSGSASFSTLIAQTPSLGGANATKNWVEQGGDNPLTSMTGSSIVLDVFQDKQTTKGSTGAVTGYQYIGDLTFTYDPTGANAATLTWDAESPSVPEPTTYGLFAGVGLLVLSVRRQLTGKIA